MLDAAIAVFALSGVFFLAAAVARARRGRFVSCLVHGGSSLVFFLAAIALGLVGTNLLTYHRLSREQAAAEIRFVRSGERSFAATITYPDGKVQNLPLAGDEWQMDARLLKWHAFANLIGFDTVYRLERLSGRYTDIASEQTEARTVHALHPAQRVDAWELARQYRQLVPWVDALYGGATFLPMSDGAIYDVSVTQSGLIARPRNEAARQAVGHWR